MTRKNKNRCRTGVNYWQSANRNNWLFNNYLNQIINLALSRFKWVNLPKTCNERFLELTLLNQGVATIATPKNNKRTGEYYSTQAVTQQMPNVYDEPVKWESFGNNGWRFDCDNSNGVLIWDNLARTPIFSSLEMYCWELVDLAVARSINRQHQKIPFILSGSQDQKRDMLNLYKQVAGGEPAVITNNEISSIEFKALKTDVPYLCNEMNTEELNIWQKIYTCLGISNMPFKAERQIEDEVNSVTEPSQMQALSPLTARRYACEQLNERFNLNISVVWRHDNITDNYQYNNNILEKEKAGENNAD